MGAKYKEFSLSQFKDFFQNINIKRNRLIWFEMVNHPSWEVIFAHDIKNTQFQIRVYTSVVKSEGVTRGFGKDAIRILIFDKLLKKPVLTPKTIYRSGNVFAKIEKRGLEVWRLFKKTDFCPICGGVLLERKGPYGIFLGCSRIRTKGCLYTKSIN